MTMPTNEESDFAKPRKNVRKSHPIFWKLMTLLVLGLLLVAVGGALFPIVDNIARFEIRKRVVLSNASELYEFWREVPVPVYMQFYLFNVSNPDDIKNGAKPRVSEVGPYSYRERRVKFDIVWNSNGTVSYRENKKFTFIPDMSAGNETDVITTINPVIAVLAQYFKIQSEERKYYAQVISLLGAGDLFITRPVAEILWGYDDELLVTLFAFDPILIGSTRVGYFINKNDTDDGLFTVYTGETDIDDIGKVTHFNGQNKFDIWTSPWANMINGTDGSISKPFSFNSAKSQFFASDACRSMTVVFRGNVRTQQGIELRRFEADPNNLANVTVNPDNIGFCIPQTHCLPGGLFNGSLCLKTGGDFLIPVVGSLPHFLSADPDVIKSVDGMQPNKLEHSTAIDIEPWTGLPLQASKRLQINMFVEDVANLTLLSQTSGIRTLYFPIMWINESFVIDDENENKLINEFFKPMELAMLAQIMLPSLGGLLSLMAIALLIRHFLK